MALKSFKPTSASRRFMTVLSREDVTAASPERALVVKLSKKGGRNNLGRITCRHHGGGHKRRYRLIDFRRNKIGIPGRVVSIEYDPNRTEPGRCLRDKPRCFQRDLPVEAFNGSPQCRKMAVPQFHFFPDPVQAMIQTHNNDVACLS